MATEKEDVSSTQRYSLQRHDLHSPSRCIRWSQHHFTLRLNVVGLLHPQLRTLWSKQISHWRRVERQRTRCPTLFDCQAGFPDPTTISEILITMNILMTLRLQCPREFRKTRTKMRRCCRKTAHVMICISTWINAYKEYIMPQKMNTKKEKKTTRGTASCAEHC